MKEKIENIVTKRVFKIIFFALVSYFLVFSKYGLIRILQFKIQTWHIHNKMEILKAKELVLNREIKLLQDPIYIKKVEKEKFGTIETE